MHSLIHCILILHQKKVIFSPTALATLTNYKPWATRWAEVTPTWKTRSTNIYLEVGCGLVNPTGGGREVTFSNLRPLTSFVGSHENEQVMNMVTL